MSGLGFLGVESDSAVKRFMLEVVRGPQAGGLTILVTFGLGWLAVGILLLLESPDHSPRPKPS